MTLHANGAFAPLFQDRGGVPQAQENSSNLGRNLLRQAQLWPARHRQRARLRELAELNDYLLQDIGVTPRDALIEAAKPFWRR